MEGETGPENVVIGVADEVGGGEILSAVPALDVLTECGGLSGLTLPSGATWQPEISATTVSQDANSKKRLQSR